jgi:cytochrome c oxidase subunit 2
MALILALILWVMTALAVYLVFFAGYWLPPAWSDAARSYDTQFMITMVVVGISFVLAQVILGWFIFKYRDKGTGKAAYIHGNSTIEIGGIILTGVVFVSLAIRSQFLWAQVHLTESPANAVHVEITAQQFIWNMRYPGPDGKFGKNDPKFYETTVNDVGVDPSDPNGKDDLMAQNILAVPVNTPIELTLRSKDVIHSFFLPTLRLKQDTMPGLAIPLRFTATQTGEFEIACAELCGAGHYKMRAFLKVMEKADYDKWLAEETVPAIQQ